MRSYHCVFWNVSVVSHHIVGKSQISLLSPQCSAQAADPIQWCPKHQLLWPPDSFWNFPRFPFMLGMCFTGSFYAGSRPRSRHPFHVRPPDSPSRPLIVSSVALSMRVSIFASSPLCLLLNLKMAGTGLDCAWHTSAHIADCGSDSFWFSSPAWGHLCKAFVEPTCYPTWGQAALGLVPSSSAGWEAMSSVPAPCAFDEWIGVTLEEQIGAQTYKWMNKERH